MTHPQVDKRGAWTQTQKHAISILNHEHVLKIMHTLRFTHIIISWEVSKESVVNVHWSHPSFGPLQPGAAAHERVEPPANHCDMAQRLSRGWSFIQFVPVHNQWVPLFHLQGQRCSWVSLVSIGVHWVQAGHWVFTEDHTLDADHHEWIQKKKSFYLRKVNVEAQAHATKKLYQHHWDGMKLGFLLKELKVSGNCHRLWWGLQGSFGPRSDKHVETHGFSLGGCVFFKPAFLLQGDVQICSPGCANCFRFYFGPSWWHCTQTVQQAAREARFQLSNLLHLLLLPFWKKPSKVLKNKPMSWNSPRVRLSKPFKTRMKELVYLYCRRSASTCSRYDKPASHQLLLTSVWHSQMRRSAGLSQFAAVAGFSPRWPWKTNKQTCWQLPCSSTTQTRES